MEYQFPGYAISYVVASILSFVTAAVTIRRRANPGTIQFTLLMLSLCIWSFATIFEAGAITLDGKLFWSKWQYIGIASLPPLWLYFTAEFTNQNFLNKISSRMILIIPLITLALAFTNEYHHLLWANVYIRSGPDNIAVYNHGPWFYVHVACSYIYLLLGTFWLVRAILRYPPKKRRQIYIIIIGLIIGWTSNILYVSGLFPIRGLDITPLSFTFIAFIISWNIFHFKLFNIVPIARDILLDNMTDGVVVLDPEGIIVDINPAAVKIAGEKDDRALLGKHIQDALKSHYRLLNDFQKMPDFQTEIQVSENPPHYLDVNISTVYDNSNSDIGKIVIFRDITSRKITEIRESEQRELAEALADTAATITSTLNLDDVFDKILQNVGKVVPHDTANIALVENGTLNFVRSKGYEKFGTEEIVPLIKCKVDEIPNLKMMSKTGRASLDPDTNANPEWDRTIPGSDWIKSYIGAPIFSKGQLLGFINLDSAVPNFFNEEHLPRLEAFANQAAVAIENAQLFEDVSNSANEMAILYEVGLAVTSGLGLEETIRTLFDQLKRVAVINLFYIALLNQTNEEITFFMYDGKGNQIVFKPALEKIKSSLTYFAINNGKTINIPDARNKESGFLEVDLLKIPGHDERSVLGIPLYLRNESIGALFMRADKPNAYNPDQIRLVETIANQASIAMDNAQLFEKIQDMAITDSLTGIYNRNYFYAIGENEIARSRRYDKNLSLMMIDIDRFKLVNDRFGHLVGDQTLIMVTDACRSVLRKADTLCRFGGEEFVIILPETKEAEARIVAERVCKVIAGKKLSTEKGNVSVTVSIGIVELKGKNDTLMDLVNKADQALYAAKEAGRNCVRSYSN